MATRPLAVRLTEAEWRAVEAFRKASGAKTVSAAARGLIAQGAGEGAIAATIAGLAIRALCDASGASVAAGMAVLDYVDQDRLPQAATLLDALRQRAVQHATANELSAHEVELRETAARGALTAVSRCYPPGSPARVQMETNLRANDWERLALDAAMTIETIERQDRAAHGDGAVIDMGAARKFRDIERAWAEPSAIQAERERDGERDELP